MEPWCCGMSRHERYSGCRAAEMIEPNESSKAGEQPRADGADAQHAAEMVARRSYGKLVAFLAARTRDVAAAEDALADAFASALEDWTRNGCPENPEAWLLTVARRKTIDNVRRRDTRDAAEPELKRIA